MTCGRCGCAVTTQQAWNEATPDRRAEWKRTGARRLAGRGLCSACYKKLCNAGGVKRRAAKVVATRKCGRCGGRASTVPLCRDCKDVAKDLGQLEVWAS